MRLPHLPYDDELPTEELRANPLHSHFLDSGAFTLFTLARQWASTTKKSQWRYFNTRGYRKYLDKYSVFVKSLQQWGGVNLYSNVDVIAKGTGPDFHPNAELSWRNQLYLEEEHGLSPIPVVHYGTDLRWLEHYIEQGYDMVALGALVGSSKTSGCREWIRNAFRIVCNTPDQRPSIKLHGFGVTSVGLITEFPWYSCDSSSWTKMGAYGGILVPQRRHGRFVFDVPPWQLKVSRESPDVKRSSRHIMNMHAVNPLLFRESVESWLREIRIPVGKMGADNETILEVGVTTRHTERRIANLLFFARLCASSKRWNSPYREQGLGMGLGKFIHKRQGEKWKAPTLRRGNSPSKVEDVTSDDLRRLIYYSGEGSRSNPEIMFCGKPGFPGVVHNNVMLTFHDFSKTGRPNGRLRRIQEATRHASES